METVPLLRIDPPGRSSDASPNWQIFLPDEWRGMVIEPFDFKQHREYEMAAMRTFGYDVDGAACYYAHSYALNESRSDDDEDFYEVVAYGESVHAWLLRDERWLIYRVVYTGGEGTPARGFYSFSEQQPR